MAAGMQGFTEKGEPENWDLAAGSVRGFRWWTLAMPLVSDPFRLQYRANPCEEVWLLPELYREREYGSYHSLYNFNQSFVAVPDAQRADISGMHGGSWRRHWISRDDKFEASCGPVPWNGISLSRAVSHSAPPPLPACGCGFWAYWNELPESDISMPFLKFSEQYEHMISIPLAGVIEGTGRTIIGEKGFRSQYARVTDIAVCASPGSQGLVYDQDAWQRQAVSPSFPHSTDYPKPVLIPHFFLDVERRTGAFDTEILNAARAVVKQHLGTGIRFHANREALLRNAKRDGNYA